MCVVSMIMDDAFDKWNRRRQPPSPWVYPMVPAPITPWVAPPKPIPVPRPLTQEELDDLRELIKRGREYDRRNNEPDCEMEEKRERLRKLAEELGVSKEAIDELLESTK